jgi:hypothetical protein
MWYLGEGGKSVQRTKYLPSRIYREAIFCTLLFQKAHIDCVLAGSHRSELWLHFCVAALPTACEFCSSADSSCASIRPARRASRRHPFLSLRSETACEFFSHGDSTAPVSGPARRASRRHPFLSLRSETACEFFSRGDSTAPLSGPLGAQVGVIPFLSLRSETACEFFSRGDSTAPIAGPLGAQVGVIPFLSLRSETACEFFSRGDSTAPIAGPLGAQVGLAYASAAGSTRSTRGDRRSDWPLGAAGQPDMGFQRARSEHDELAPPVFVRSPADLPAMETCGHVELDDSGHEVLSEMTSWMYVAGKGRRQKLSALSIQPAGHPSKGAQRWKMHLRSRG